MSEYPQRLEVAMSEVTVGKWGKNLAVRFPLEFAKTAGLREGERVQIEGHDGDIVIRRPLARARADAEAAAEEIISESRNHPLGEVTIRELLEEGRRG
jgi:antitoxin component of MazEF toxin-antitoxin module